MKSTSMRTSWQKALALVTLVTLSFGLVPAAEAASPTAQSQSTDPLTRIEPSLRQAAQASPDTKFAVIVRRQAAANKAQARAQETELENEARNQGASAGDRLGLIDGHAMTLTGRQILGLARQRLVKQISPDRQVKLHQVATTGSITTVATTTTAPATVTSSAPALLSTWTQQANAPQVWSTYGNTGAGVTVAVLDSGIQPSADLSNVVFGADTATNTIALGDLGGHGTHVAGIIAGNGTLSGGAYKGIAPSARLVSVKVTNDTGGASYSSVIKGLQWVVVNKDVYHIRVVNLSLGAKATTGYDDDPLNAAVEMAWFRGIVVVASAGNNGPGAQTISVPANDPYVIAVGAYDDSQSPDLANAVIPTWTSQGPTAFDGLAKPDIAASGRRVVSLRVPGSYLDTLLPDRVTQTNYFRLSGTSMAAPVVSGVAALLIAQNPLLTPDQVKAILTRSARPMPYAASSVGAGAVDAMAAIKVATDGTYSRANVGLRANNQAAQALWRVIKSMPHPVWRINGTWNGRYWSDGGWDVSGFLLNGTWNDGGWDATAWSNFRWEDGGWDVASWLDGGWDSLTSLNITLSDGGWDTKTFVD